VGGANGFMPALGSDRGIAYRPDSRMYAFRAACPHSTLSMAKIEASFKK